MNRAERRRAARQLAKRPAGGSLLTPPALDGEYVIVTFPGCSKEEHALEVMGASMALDARGGAPWSGIEQMDCGCTLQLVRV